MACMYGRCRRVCGVVVVCAGVVYGVGVRCYGVCGYGAMALGVRCAGVGHVSCGVRVCTLCISFYDVVSV